MMNLDNKSDIIHENIKSLSWGDKINLAQNPNTPATTLEQLATDEDWMVRWDVAENPNTPPKALELLATVPLGSVWGIRRNVTKNLNTPHYIKKFLKIQEHLATL